MRNLDPGHFFSPLIFRTGTESLLVKAIRESHRLRQRVIYTGIDIGAILPDPEDEDLNLLPDAITKKLTSISEKAESAQRQLAEAALILETLSSELAALYKDVAAPL